MIYFKLGFQRLWLCFDKGIFGMGRQARNFFNSTTLPTGNIRGNQFMRSILFAGCLALGAATAIVAPSARAEVDVRVPGVVIDTGRDHHVNRREPIRRDEYRCDRDRDHCHR